MRPVFDPTGGPDVLVEKMIGTAYETVKRVYCHLPEIRRLDDVLAEIPTLAQTTVDNALAVVLPPILDQLDEKVQAAEGWAGEAEASAEAAAQSALAATKVNMMFPFVFNSLQLTYDVTVIAGRDDVTTAGLALWVEGAIEYDFTILSGKTFMLNEPSSYPENAQMRIIVNSRFDDLVKNFEELQEGFAEEFKEFLEGSALEVPVPYASGIVITRPTQTVSHMGRDYRVNTAYIPLTTTAWSSDSPKLLLVGEGSLRGELETKTDASKGAGQIANSIITVNTVAEMVSLVNWKLGQQVRTLGYYLPGDGGENVYSIVPAGTGPVDAGRFIDVAGFQAKGAFPDGTARSKQFGTMGDNLTPNQDAKIRSALALILTDSIADAMGADVPLNLGAYLVGATIAVLGDRSLRGTAGPNAAKLIADTAIASGSALITLPGAFSIIERLGLRIPSTIYNPVTNTGKPVDGLKVDSASSFGNIIKDARVNGGRIAIHLAAGLESKIQYSFIVGSNIGIQNDAWDTEINNTIIQDCKQYGVNAVGHGLEATALHIVRCAILLNLISNGAPVNLSGTFLDTPLTIGTRFNDQRRARFTNTYILKIGNNANAAAVGMKFENNSSDNVFVGGSNINDGENFLSVFQFDDSSVNNTFAFWHTNTKTVNVPASMRKQSNLDCKGDHARYNNFPRKNRGVVSGVVAGGTASLVLTLDYVYPAMTYNTLLFYGKWVSRNSSSQGAFGDISLPVQYGDTGCAPVVTKTSGGANITWVVTSVSLAGNQLTVNVQNNGTATSSLSIEIERSMDATGVTF